MTTFTHVTAKFRGKRFRSDYFLKLTIAFAPFCDVRRWCHRIFSRLQLSRSLQTKREVVHLNIHKPTEITCSSSPRMLLECVQRSGVTASHLQRRRRRKQMSRDARFYFCPQISTTPRRTGCRHSPKLRPHCCSQWEAAAFFFFSSSVCSPPVGKK